MGPIPLIGDCSNRVSEKLVIEVFLALSAANYIFSGIELKVLTVENTKNYCGENREKCIVCSFK